MIYILITIPLIITILSIVHIIIVKKSKQNKDSISKCPYLNKK